MNRIPLAYPKMPGSRHSPTGPCIAFEKYDGTNLHWVWDRELGWYAFGTRRRRFDLDEIGIQEFRAAHPGLVKTVISASAIPGATKSRLWRGLGEILGIACGSLLLVLKRLTEKPLVGKIL